MGRSKRKDSVKGCFSREQKARNGCFYYFFGGVLSHKSMNWSRGEQSSIPQIYELLSHKTMEYSP